MVLLMINLKCHINLNKLLNEFCNKDFIIDDLQSKYYKNLLAEQISSGYKNFKYHSLKPDLLKRRYINCIDFNKYKIRDSYLNPLFEINEIVKSELLDKIKGFYFHGSMSTMDYAKGWSDVDTFIILKKKTVCDQKKILEVKNSIKIINNLKKKIDPLQHHGVGVFTEYDLRNFPDILMPLNSLGPISATGGSIMKFSYNERISNLKKKNLIQLLNFIIKTHKKGVFEHHSFKNEYLLTEYKNSKNGMYQLKYYLGIFLLLPSLYLGVVQGNTYKKNALSKINNLFSKKSVEWINNISNLRKNWHLETKGKYVPNAIPRFVKEYIPKNYFELGSNCAKDILNSLKN
jgi:hypothetical protein